MRPISFGGRRTNVGTIWPAGDDYELAPSQLVHRVENISHLVEGLLKLLIAGAVDVALAVVPPSAFRSRRTVSGGQTNNPQAAD